MSTLHLITIQWSKPGVSTDPIFLTSLHVLLRFHHFPHWSSSSILGPNPGFCIAFCFQEFLFFWDSPSRSSSFVTLTLLMSRDRYFAECYVLDFWDVFSGKEIHFGKKNTEMMLCSTWASHKGVHNINMSYHLLH